VVRDGGRPAKLYWLEPTAALTRGNTERRSPYAAKRPCRAGAAARQLKAHEDFRRLSQETQPMPRTEYAAAASNKGWQR
jgi:hypothetical protein